MNDVGKSYIDGIVLGLEENTFMAIAKANEIAAAIIEVYRSIWDVNSPSKVGIGLTKSFVKGLEIGMDDSNLLTQSASMVNGILATGSAYCQITAY